MTTPEQALLAVQRFLPHDTPSCHVEGLLEDDKDFFALLEPDDPNGPLVVGGSSVFVSKKTGKIWLESAVYVLDKINAMQPCHVAVP